MVAKRPAADKSEIYASQRLDQPGTRVEGLGDRAARGPVYGDRSLRAR